MSGEGDQLKGKIKDTVGYATNDRDLQREGKADQAGGKVKEAATKAKGKVDGAVDALKGRFRKG